MVNNFWCDLAKIGIPRLYPLCLDSVSDKNLVDFGPVTLEFWGEFVVTTRSSPASTELAVCAHYNSKNNVKSKF